MPRRVAVFTGTRAEYGLLSPLLRRLEQDPWFELQLIASGAHLSDLHGRTIETILADGFRVDARVEMLLSSDTPTAVTKSIGLALIDLAVRFETLQPDVVVILGDRYEALAAAIAACIANIPVAHIHGGEVTEGAFDDSIRHAITKLSHLHFVAAEDFATRVRQLGEDPARIHVVGAPAIDTISTLRPIPLEDLSHLLGGKLEPPIVVVVYHPSTIPGEDPRETTSAILDAVDRFDPATVVVSRPNADPGNRAVRSVIDEWVPTRSGAIAIDSIGHEAFLSLVSHAEVMVGNSSAGVIEAPVLGTPSVNVGQRQAGRPLAPSVIDESVDAERILAAIVRASQLRRSGQIRPEDSPYFNGVAAAASIADVLRNADLDQLVKKSFRDLA